MKIIQNEGGQKNPDLKKMSGWLLLLLQFILIQILNIILLEIKKIKLEGKKENYLNSNREHDDCIS